jgi:3-hydroxybutyryl-CoA dehydrogenase
MGQFKLQEDGFSVAVIGAGTMGAGIAQVAAQAGHPVVLVDASLDALDRAKASHIHVFSGLVAKGKRMESEAALVLSRLVYATDLQEVQGTRLVIEAVVERADVKADLFSTLERYVAEDAVLATNTSSLSVTGVAAACTRPERVIGLHFFNPAPLMALVEVIPALQTHPALPAACADLLHRWGKEPALARDTPGFIVNRVARPYYGEALRCVEEGIATPMQVDSAMRHLGFRMGPFELMDLIGNDINFAVTSTVFAATFSDPRYRPSIVQERLVQAGWLGRKSGRGHYDYAQGNPAPEPLDLPEVSERILAMLINEAADAVFWGIATATDVDRAMVRGVNYPRGLCAWSDALGPDWAVQRLDGLHARFGEDRYRCSPLLRDQVDSGKRFF